MEIVERQHERSDASTAPHDVGDRLEEQVASRGLVGDRGSRLGKRVDEAAEELAPRPEGVGQEFVVSPTAGLFVNAAFGWPVLPAVNLPSGGPAYPEATPAVRLTWKPNDQVTFRAAIFNGDHDSHLDMLHNSPDSAGIAWERDNVYWVLDGAHRIARAYLTDVPTLRDEDGYASVFVDEEPPDLLIESDDAGCRLARLRRASAPADPPTREPLRAGDVASRNGCAASLSSMTFQ